MIDKFLLVIVLFLRHLFFGVQVSPALATGAAQVEALVQEAVFEDQGAPEKDQVALNSNNHKFFELELKHKPLSRSIYVCISDYSYKNCTFFFVYWILTMKTAIKVQVFVIIELISRSTVLLQ